MSTPRSDASTTAVDTRRPATSRAWKPLIGAGVGNALEWYDWSAYAIFAPFFARQFFVQGDATSALLATLAVFAVGFVMRPLGGLVFGWLADRRGRRYSMTTSMLLMAAGSLLLGVAPTDAQIGVWAAVVLVLARLGQGLAHGGEIAASYTYVAEVAPTARRGLWSTSLYISVSAGILLASLIGASFTSTLSTDAVAHWGWRVPFLIGGLLGLVSLYLRRSLPETPAYTAEQTRDAGSPRSRTARELVGDLVHHRVSVARIIGFSLASTVVYYVWAVGISGFALTTRGVPASGALIATVAANIVFILTLPLWGALSDRFGRRPVFLTYGVAFTLLTIPLLHAVNSSPIRLFLVSTVALFFLGAFVGIMPAYFAELFPTTVRASGVGIPYSFIVAIFGGTAPYLLTWAASRDLLWLFGLYVIALVLIGVVTTLLSPETAGRDLT